MAAGIPHQFFILLMREVPIEHTTVDAEGMNRAGGAV
jgi:hypothetical protein